uniref:Transcription regulator n=1 Tax=Kwoniella bestiolae CBS 10118 TaxID=1296100 RepID=A0A1B9G3E2_9TREE|nr:hypothetical protein I302_05363 [Kwoniella bestiolae CBS 10118]OCF25543.1 hypothetical protein I302_05363 [Kwoniella bestiolae CBS 10118]
MTTALSSHSTFLQDILDRQTKRRKLIDPSHTFPAQVEIRSLANSRHATDIVHEDNVPSKEKVLNYVKEEDTVRNDYAAWFGRGGREEVGSNFILGAKDEEICEEYPALKKLMTLKSTLVSTHSHPPLYTQLPSIAPSAIQSALGTNKFDVILINPLISSWEETSNLPIRQISSDPSFVFLWVGRGDNEGLERGRECFAKWGFRRAEDIVWVKTNKLSLSSGQGVENGSLFASQKEHCLMGIRGTVRRSTDMRSVHCNVDTDVMIWEGEDEPDSPAFPPYLYTLIENFCLGTRRLELFPTSPNPRKGWVTASTIPLPETSTSEEQVQPFDHTVYPTMVPESDGRPILPYHTEIDSLRPKSPQRRPRNLPGGGGTGNLTPNTTGGRPSPNPGSAGFRPNNHNRPRPPPPQQQQQQNMGMQGFNPFVGGGMMNPMGMNMMGMMPFGGPPYVGMGVNNGQPGNFQQMPMGMGMGMPMQMPMQMPMGMGMGMGMPFGGGFDPMNMMNMGGYNAQHQQGQGQGPGQGNPQNQNQGGMGWQGQGQGNWQ